MRKLLLATSALVALTGSAMAAEQPIAVNVGGYVDFRAALMHQNDAVLGRSDATGSDFQNEFQVNIEATGKTTHGVEYGAKVGLWNGNDFGSNASDTKIKEHDAYVWLSGKFGKAVFGDSHSASTDLFVGAPTVGEGQIDGSYTNFVDQTKLMPITPSYADDDNNSTKVTYYTPKVGNADHKVQLGVSFTPNYDQQGSAVALYKTSVTSYKNVTGAGLQYTGKFGPVSAVASGIMNVGSGSDANSTKYKDFTSYGAGAQLTYAGVTVGGSYVDAGHMGEIQGQTPDQGKAQDVWTFGVKYGFDKVELAANVMDGRGYSQYLTSLGSNYVRDFQAYGAGATYNWFPGFTTAADAVLFKQKVDATTTPSEVGHVFMISQKLAF
jgi:hypothetical protein